MATAQFDRGPEGFSTPRTPKSSPFPFFQRGQRSLLPTAKELAGRITFVIALLVILTAASFAHAQNLPAAEKQKIEALIKQVGDLKDAKFVRNDSAYEPATAVRFLRGKWDANRAEVKSARDFIDKVATKSGTSGKPYLMRYNDGKDITSREFLLAELKKLE